MALAFSAQGCAQQVGEYQVSSEDRQPIDIRRGMSTFAHFCYGTAPSFDNLEDEALSGNFNLMPNGWLEHSNYELSMVVRDYENYKNCQFIFVSDQSVKEFEESMKYPFKAKEIPKAESPKLYRSDAAAKALESFINRTFVSKTTFDGDVPAVFYGYILNSPSNSVGKNSFALFLYVEKK